MKNLKKNLPSIITIIILCLFASPENGNILLSKEKKDKKKTEEAKKLEREKKKKKEKLEKDRAQWIEDTLKYGIHKERIDAINKINKIKNKNYKNKLVKQLVKLIKIESDPEVLVKAITVASDLKEKSMIGLMPEKMKSKSDDVKIAAVYAIKHLKASNLKKNLISEINKQDFSEESRYTEALIHTLGEFKACEFADTAITKIKDVNTTRNNRQLLVLFLGKSGSKNTGNFLLKTYNDEDEEVIIRSYAVNSLAKLRISESTGHIVKLLDKIESYPFKKKKKYYNLYLYSVAALVKFEDKNALPKLMNTLRSDNSTARLKAVKLLKELKDKRTIDILKYKMKYDPNKKVQKAAKEALKEMGVKTEEKKKE